MVAVISMEMRENGRERMFVVLVRIDVAKHGETYFF